MKLATFNQRYEVIVPDHIAEWDAIAEWERQRFLSMEANLRPGMVLVDVGAEHGCQSAIYARFVGGAQNMVLIEPTAQFWPNIRATFDANRLGLPRVTYVGLVGDECDDEPQVIVNAWPIEAAGPEQPARSYRYLHEESHNDTPRTTLDALGLDRVDAVTIDVEGAELLVLKGAEAMLRQQRPLVWCSIHPDLMARDYGGTRLDVLVYMDGLGYTAHNLAVDHEEHWAFAPVERTFTSVPR